MEENGKLPSYERPRMFLLELKRTCPQLDLLTGVKILELLNVFEMEIRGEYEHT